MPFISPSSSKSSKHAVGLRSLSRGTTDTPGFFNEASSLENAIASSDEKVPKSDEIPTPSVSSPKTTDDIIRHYGGASRKGPASVLVWSWVGAALLIGLITIGMESNLTDLAAATNVSLEDISVALVWRAFGGVVGAALIYPCLVIFNTQRMLGFTSFASGVLLLSFPWLKVETSVFWVFACLGGLLPLQESTLQLLMARHCNEGSTGSMQQIINLSVFLAIMLCPLLHYIMGFSAEYIVLAVFSMAAGIFTFFQDGSVPDSDITIAQNKAAQPAKVEAAGGGCGGNGDGIASGVGGDLTEGRVEKVVEVLACFLKELNEMDWVGTGLSVIMLLLAIVAYIQTVSYCGAFATELGLVEDSSSDLYLLTYLIPGMVSVTLCIPLQHLWLNTLNRVCIFMTIALGISIVAVTVSASLAYYPDTAPSIHWVAMAFFGFTFSPALGMAYDVWLQSTNPSELSVGLVIGITYCVPSIGAYETYKIWVMVDDPATLMFSNLLCLLIALLAMAGLWRKANTRKISSGMRSLSAPLCAG